MKFGIHLMRGIPRQAVRLNTPILGTPARARDIADTKAICSWNGDMYGVDMRSPGAQAYYDSVFKLYASWGVDFVKMDDMSRPYESNWPEVEAAHKAIAASGRPIVAQPLAGRDRPALGHARAALRADVAHLGRLLGRMAPAGRQFQRLENWNPGDGPRTPGPMPTCCRWAASPSARATPSSRRTSSRP
jgi:alpha-galactosidase